MRFAPAVAAAVCLSSCSAEGALFPDVDGALAELSAAADRARGFERFADAGAAASAIIARADPLVVGFGEYHATTDGAKVVPSLTRFADDILPAIAAGAKGLVLETYVQQQGCGQSATTAAKDVETTIKRPAETESHIMRLLRLSKAAGVQGYILERMSCADLAELYAGGEVDYAKLLALISERLGDKIEEVFERSGGRVLVYGGSMHNEAVPDPAFAEYSYAARVGALTGGRYLEIDFLVPELIAGDRFLPEQPWFATAMEEASADSVLVFRRSPASYVIIARRRISAAAKGAPRRGP